MMLHIPNHISVHRREPQMGLMHNLFARIVLLDPGFTLKSNIHWLYKYTAKDCPLVNT